MEASKQKQISDMLQVSELFPLGIKSMLLRHLEELEPEAQNELREALLAEKSATD